MRLGYVLSRYPLLSETFILREMLELQHLGWELDIAPLRRVRSGPVHEATASLRSQVSYLSWRRKAVWRAGWRALAQARAWRLWGAALWGSLGDGNLVAGALAYGPAALAIAERFQRAGVEHIHAHYATHPALVAWLVHRLTGIPYSFTVHAHDIFEHERMLATKVAGARFVVAISEFNRAWICRRVPAAAAEKVHVIRCGVPGERYRDAAAAAEVKAGDGSTVRPLRLLCVGSLQPYKGHAVLLEALARLPADLHWRCDCIGGGALRPRLEQQTAALGLSDRLRWLGPQPEAAVTAALGRSDIVVLASVREPSGKMEGIPLALMEAMAAERAVIGTALSGIPELIRSGQEGWLVPPGDAAALAAALLQLRLPERRRRLGVAARRRIAAAYDLHTNVAQLAALLANAGGVRREVSAGTAAVRA